MYNQMNITEYLYGVSLPDDEFFMNEDHQIQYNEVCMSCTRKCKQSFRSTVIQCPFYSARKGRSSRK